MKNILTLFLSAALLLSCQQEKEHKQNTTVQEAPAQENFFEGTSITMGGEEIHTAGVLPEVGTQAKEFSLADKDMNDKTLADFAGKNVILNIFPSVDTKVCSESVRTFNKEAADLENTVVLCISKDLPFAQERFCGAEGIENVVMLSDFRSDFGEQYGVKIAEGAMEGLLSRAVVIVNPEGKVVYTEQVPELSQEPDYSAALASLE